MDKIRLLQLSVVMIIAAQGIFYLMGGATAAKNMSATTFAAFRNAVDHAIAGKMRLLYYVALFSGLVVVAWSRMEFPMLTGLTLIAVIMVVIDIILAMRFSLPINRAFHFFPNGHDTEAWKDLQLSWIKLICIRGTCAVIALIALLISWKK